MNEILIPFVNKITELDALLKDMGWNRDSNIELWTDYNGYRITMTIDTPSDHE